MKDGEKQTAKIVYHQPRVTDYGDIKVITRGKTNMGKLSDALTGKTK
jgi:hypothetical protein